MFMCHNQPGFYFFEVEYNYTIAWWEFAITYTSADTA